MWYRIVLVIACSMGMATGAKGGAALTAPVAANTQAALPTSDAQASAEASKLLAENPYEGRADQQPLDGSDQQKAEAVIKNNGSKIKSLAYASGRLTWRGVKAAVKFVRKVAGLGVSFAAQIFKMVIFYCCFNATMALVMPRVLSRI